MNTAPLHETHAHTPGGMLDRMARLLAPPADALGGRGTLAAPLLLVLASSAAGAAWLQGPVAQAQAASLSPGALWTLAMLSPVVALAKGLFLAAMAWALLVLWSAPARFVRVLSAVLYGEAILALQNLWIAGVVAARGRFDPTDPVHVGLDAVVGSGHPVLLAVARGVTPFHLAWIVFLALALAPRRDGPRWKGWAVACALWATTAGLLALRAGLVKGVP